MVKQHATKQSSPLIQLLSSVIFRESHGRTTAAPGKWLLYIGSLGLLIAAVSQLGLLLFEGISNSINVVQLTDDAMLKAIFSGGEPWLVQCMYPMDKVAKSTNQIQRTMKVIELNKKRLREYVSLAIINCKDNLPNSKRSLISRYSLKPNTLLLAVANGDPPVAMDRYDKIEHLLSDLLKVIVPKVHKISIDRNLRENCLAFRSCIVIGHKGALESNPVFKRIVTVTVPEILSSHRKVRAVHTDTKINSVKLDLALANEKKKRGMGGNVDIICIVSIDGEHGASEVGMRTRKNPTLYGRFLEGDPSDLKSLAAFIADCQPSNVVANAVPDRGSFVKLLVAPSVSRRAPPKPGRPDVKPASSGDKQQEGYSSSGGAEGGGDEGLLERLEEDFEEVEI